MTPQPGKCSQIGDEVLAPWVTKPRDGNLQGIAGTRGKKIKKDGSHMAALHRHKKKSC